MNLTVGFSIEKCYEKAGFHETSQLQRVTRSFDKDHIKEVLFTLKIIVLSNIQIAATKLRGKNKEGPKKSRFKTSV